MRAALSILALAVIVTASGCGQSGPADDRPTVVAGFYPLAWAAEQVGGHGFRVVNLTPAGAEPHDLELSPRDIQTIEDAELVLYVGGGFQPALEEAVESRVGPSLELSYGGADPHVWLDPVRFARTVADLSDSLLDTDAARRPLGELQQLHREYRDGLSDCDRRTVVTTHAAFGQLARRYGLTQHPIAGSSPESEPSPKDLERIVGDVRASGTTTVFTEPLVSSRLAETVAREAGVDVATLDPIEGLSEDRLAAGDDYISVMRSNLETLREALECR